MQLLIAALVSALALTSASPAPAVRNLAGRDVAPEGNEHIDISVNGKVFPPDIPGQEFPQNLQINCKNCFARGDMSISAGGKDLFHELTPDSNFTSSYVQAANFDFTRNWVGVALEGFTAHVELDINLTPADNANELVIHLLGVPRTIRGIAGGLAVTFDPQIHGFVNVSRAVTFTHGFDLSVPSGSTLLIPVAHVDETIAVGFQDSKITLTDFQSAIGDLEMNFQLSYRPTYKIEVDSLVFEAHADLPKLDVAVTQVSNANADCVSGGSGRAFPQLTKLETSIGMDIGLNFLDQEFVPVDFSAPLQTAAPVQCYEYKADKKILVAPGTDGKNAAISSSRASVLLAFVSAFVALAFV